MLSSARSWRGSSAGLLSFKYFNYEDLIAKDKTSLDIFWLKDDSLDNLDNLPAPAILQQEIIDHLEAALASFRDVAEGLPEPL